MVRTGHWPSTGIAFSLVFSGFFFVLALATAVGEDIRRNRTTEERTIAWNPQLMWRNFIYLGAVGFFVAAFLAYHQARHRPHLGFGVLLDRFIDNGTKVLLNRSPRNCCKISITLRSASEGEQALALQDETAGTMATRSGSRDETMVCNVVCPTRLPVNRRANL